MKGLPLILLINFLAINLLIAGKKVESEIVSNESNKFIKIESPSIQKLVIKGENPRIIYVPIIHDGPYNHLSTTSLENVEEILKNCHSIADLLYDKYDVKNLMLEGVSKKVAQYYNKRPDGKKIKFNAKMKTWQAWAGILNSKEWNAIASSNVTIEGPLTKLGYEYSNRIVSALNKAKGNGWFKSRDSFINNQKSFQKLIAQACKGHNEKYDAILKEDPKLQKEYDLTVTERNRVFIENTLAAKGTGLILCGVAHTHNLLKQLEMKNISYSIVIPKGIEWPVKEKSEDEIYADMLKLGCQLKECNLKFGDGTSAKIKLPIK